MVVEEEEEYQVEGREEAAQVKSQGDSFFLTDGHKAILNELNSKSNTNRFRTNIVNKNKQQQKPRSVINYRGGGGGVNRFYAAATSP